MRTTWVHVRRAGFLVLLALGMLAAVGVVASRAGEPVAPSDVKGPYTWGAAGNVTRLHHLWLAGQPDAAGFEAARDAGITVVIDMRDPSERDWDEAVLVEDLGLAYHNVPVTGPAFDPAAFARIEQLVHENEDAQILVHCSSSNRAGGWLAVHLVERHGMSVDDAVAVGRRMGITKDAIEQRVRAYPFSSTGSGTGAGQPVAGGAPAPPPIEGPAALHDEGRRAQSALLPLKKGLMGALKSALAESPEAAVDACKLAAPGITAGAGAPGLRVGRTSHRTRNPDNAPEAWMNPLLEHYLEQPRTPRPARVVDLGEGRVGYVEPIYTQALCTTCHGSAVDASLLSLIRERYPEDRAIGFEEGELRGLFWAVVEPGTPAPAAH